MVADNYKYKSIKQFADLKPIFLAWASLQGSHRSQFLSQMLGIEFIRAYSSSRNNLMRLPFHYIMQSFQSLKVLFRQRPRLIFVQNPPIFAAMIVYFYSLISGARFIIDSHTSALLGKKWHWSLPLHKFLSRNAIVTIVTNHHLASILDSWGARTLIISDVPFIQREARSWSLDPNMFNLVYVTSWAFDEPLSAVLKAVRGMQGVKVYITGDHNKSSSINLEKVPENVVITGYLNDDDYYGLLKSSQAIMCLTTRDHTFQSGAREALWLGKPIIISNWPLLREYFYMGTVHVDNSSEQVRTAIQGIILNQSRYEQEIIELQTLRFKEWEVRMIELTKIVTQSYPNI